MVTMVSRSSDDAVRQWATVSLLESPGAKLLTADVHASFTAWNAAQGRRYVWGRRAFADALVRCGYSLGRGTNGVRVLLGYEFMVAMRSSSGSARAPS